MSLQPGELLFNWFAFGELLFGLFLLAMGIGGGAILDPWWWLLFLGPLTLLICIVTIIARIPRNERVFRYEARRGITGWRRAFEAYRAKYGNDFVLRLLLVPPLHFIGLIVFLIVAPSLFD